MLRCAGVLCTWVSHWHLAAPPAPVQKHVRHILLLHTGIKEASRLIEIGDRAWACAFTGAALHSRRAMDDRSRPAHAGHMATAQPCERAWRSTEGRSRSELSASRGVMPANAAATAQATPSSAARDSSPRKLPLRSRRRRRHSWYLALRARERCLRSSAGMPACFYV